MRIAFYAPLKPPDHPVPSGDRRVAQLLLAALARAGHQPFVAARLRSYDGTGDRARQARLAEIGERHAARLIRRWRRAPSTAPELWLTYHLYYKAPDWLGPAVSRALGIPYIVAEASFAAKRDGGAWALGHLAVEQAIRRADAVIGLNSADRPAVLPLLASPVRWITVPPFLDAGGYRPATHENAGPPRLIAVAMMRAGDKLASYRALGAALALLLDLPWTLEIIGNGPARGAVEAAMAPLGERVTYAGALDPAAIAARLAAADCCVWPAINEAFGMALLEAQAAGLPVVAGAGGGVGDIIAANETGLLVPPSDPSAFALAVRGLLSNPAERRRMGRAARRKILHEHDLTTAADRLAAAVAGLRQADAA